MQPACSCATAQLQDVRAMECIGVGAQPPAHRGGTRPDAPTSRWLAFEGHIPFPGGDIDLLIEKDTDVAVRQVWQLNIEHAGARDDGRHASKVLRERSDEEDGRKDAKSPHGNDGGGRLQEEALNEIQISRKWRVHCMASVTVCMRICEGLQACVRAAPVLVGRHLELKDCACALAGVRQL